MVPSAKLKYIYYIQSKSVKNAIYIVLNAILHAYKIPTLHICITTYLNSTNTTIRNDFHIITYTDVKYLVIFYI